MENTALTTWTDGSAGAEATQQIDDSAAAKKRDTDEATAQHTYAYAAADNQWTFDEDTAGQVFMVGSAHPTVVAAGADRRGEWA